MNDVEQAGTPFYQGKSQLNINSRYSRFKPSEGVETGFENRIIQKIDQKPNRIRSLKRLTNTQATTSHDSKRHRSSRSTNWSNISLTYIVVALEKKETKREKIQKANAALFKKKYFLLPNSNRLIVFEALHLILIIYSTFALAIRVGFDLKLKGFLLVMELLALLENVVYIVVQLRTAQYDHGMLSLDLKLLLRHYWQKGMWADLVGLVPFNIIFSIY